MKRLTLLIVHTVLTWSTLDAQDVCKKASELVERLNATHIQPLTIDDSLSARLFSEFFFTLDPDANLFTQQDIKGLAGFRFHLDEELKSPTCDFIAVVDKLYKQKTSHYGKFADSLLSRPISFREGEFGDALYSPGKSFTRNQSELKAKWIHDFKLEILGRIYRQSKGGEKISDATATDRVRQSTARSIARLTSTDVRKYVEMNFLKSVAHIFDPHSEYFSEDEMQAFEDSLNPEVLSFGIEFEDSRVGEVKVARLAPGGPAWNSGQIHQGDVITLVEFDPGEEHNVQDLDALSLAGLLDAPEKTTATLTFRKADGETRSVPLAKSRIENKENLITGLVLKGKNTYGYISLPSFYTVSENEGNSGCANDVAKEILKLNKEKIDGLILDLRFNGGGSMKEAIDLAGIFIDVGPIAVMQTRDEPGYTLKDMNRGMAYTGPLVVMVSKASASASELVAAALQDYGRAIIVGSPTYGKATGQVVLPVNASTGNSAFIKVTQERLFRITGASLQQTGVQVDYVLPNLMEVLVPGEKAERFSFTPTTISKKTYYTRMTPWFPDASKGTAAASRERISRSPGYASVTNLASLFTKPVPLGKVAFTSFMDQVTALAEIPAASTTDPLYTVANTAANERVFSVDTYHQQINAEQMEDVRKSIYVREVYLILEDILNGLK